MTYEDALAYMDRLTPLGWQPGLERFTEFCKRLGDPQERFKSVHVAGTNGKGSTTAMIASILQAAGYKVGMYVSPYVHDIRERVQVNGRMISEEDFVRLLESMIPCAEGLAETDFGHPTEFEFKTALGFLYYAEQECRLRGAWRSARWPARRHEHRDSDGQRHHQHRPRSHRSARHDYGRDRL